MVEYTILICYTSSTNNNNKGENKMNPIYHEERAAEYKKETGKEYFIDRNKLQPKDPKFLFTAYSLSFERYALNVRELVVIHDNVPYGEISFCYYENMQNFEAQKQNLIKLFWEFERMNRYDPKGCIFDHMEWCCEVIRTCDEYIEYCKELFKAECEEAKWEMKNGA